MSQVVKVKTQQGITVLAEYQTLAQVKDAIILPPSCNADAVFAELPWANVAYDGFSQAAQRSICACKELEGISLRDKTQEVLNKLGIVTTKYGAPVSVGNAKRSYSGAFYCNAGDFACSGSLIGKNIPVVYIAAETRSSRIMAAKLGTITVTERGFSVSCAKFDIMQAVVALVKKGNLVLIH